MKKSIYLLIIFTILLLAGCSKKDQMTNFIPTQAPEEDTDSAQVSEEAEQEDTTETAATPTPGTIHVGETTTMYVRLDEYGGYLNVRSTPSKDGEAVGFLVHAEEVEVIKIVDGWASFVYDDAICYVNADFLVEERPDYLTPPPPTPTPIVTPTQAPGTAEASPEI